MENETLYPIGTRVQIHLCGTFYNPDLHDLRGEVIGIYTDRERKVLLDRDKGKSNRPYCIYTSQLKPEQTNDSQIQTEPE